MHVASPSSEVRTLQHAHSSAVTVAPSFVLINSLLWLALNKSAISEENTYVREATVRGVAKTTGEAWAIGQKVYWVAGTSSFSTTSAGNTLAGRAAKAAASGDTTGDIHFDTYAA